MRAGTFLIIAGTAAVFLGVMLRWVPGLFSWFGNLPGDIHHRSANTTVFFPITSMVVVSVALSIVAYLVRKLIP